ncbi:matrix-remodeling-associated protein 7 isoform X2 [Carettochelys insculpta]|uniref:matrix-remodeling-associated protein 7 isoform X2 n=1 Tax=Carettochelys insculpta TaxID=44489 RepID=UPI003EBCFC82
MTPGGERVVRPAPAVAERGSRTALPADTPRGGRTQAGSGSSAAAPAAAMDPYLAVPLLVTLLAVILASLFVKLRPAGGAGAGRGDSRAAGEGTPSGPEEQPQPQPQEEGEEGRRIPLEELGAARSAQEDEEPQPQEAAAARTDPAQQQSPAPELSAPRPAAAELAEEEEDDEEEEEKEEDQDWKKERLVVKEPDLDDADDQITFKYSPGKLRGSQYKTMMTKEELEEEQRVQREQLTAIFRLMEENSEKFGEMSEGDVKEQLKLYDM